MLLKNSSETQNTVPKYKIDTQDPIGKALDAFLNHGLKSGKHGHYFIDGNRLVYRTVVTEKFKTVSASEIESLIQGVKDKSVLLESHTLEQLEASSDARNVRARVLKEDLIALRVKNGSILGNSSTLELVGRLVAYGREVLNRNETDIQRRMSRLIPMVPFTVFQQAKLDINSYQVVERGKEELITRSIPNPKFNHNKKVSPKNPERIDETVHFTGASLFTVGQSYFLFDIDRREVEHKIFNPFLVKLPMPVFSIQEAYQALMPSEVKWALKDGLKVKRQGEWFFIPVEYSGESDRTKNRWSDVWSTALELRAGNNRPNIAEYGVKGLHYVKGKISHSGREHADLFLESWHKAIPNTAVESFTITGDID